MKKHSHPISSNGERGSKAASRPVGGGARNHDSSNKEAQNGLGTGSVPFQGNIGGEALLNEPLFPVTQDERGKAYSKLKKWEWWLKEKLNEAKGKHMPIYNPASLEEMILEQIADQPDWQMEEVDAFSWVFYEVLRRKTVENAL